MAVGAGWRGGRAARSGAGAWARPRRTPPTLTLTPMTATTTTSTTLRWTSSNRGDPRRGVVLRPHDATALVVVRAVPSSLRAFDVALLLVLLVLLSRTGDEGGATGTIAEYANERREFV